MKTLISNKLTLIIICDLRAFFRGLFHIYLYQNSRLADLSSGEARCVVENYEIIEQHGAQIAFPHTNTACAT